MPQEATDRKPPKTHQGAAAPPPPEQEHLRCPRCNSTNTKFCYYNNYNSSQPRHFCKACRRYWTHGGTLRDIPVGGGSRKNAKRSRTSVAGTDAQHPLPATPVIFPVPATVYSGGPPCDGGEGKGSLGLCGSFTSLLNSNGPGFLALSGFGFGIGPALEDVGFGLGKGNGMTVWPFPGIGDGGAAAVSGGSGGGAVGLASPWQFEGGDQGGFIAGDCFTWSDLAISTPGNGLK